MNRLIALGALALLASPTLAPRAHAAVVDTISFSNPSNWSKPLTDFSGQFTGTVEPDGLIQLADLSAFSVSGDVLGVPWFFGAKDDLQFFSYDASGTGALGFIAANGLLVVCSGAPSVLDPRCNRGGANPASTRAVIVGIVGGITYTPDQTAVTLVSSVSTPEPSTWAMMLIGLAGLGAIGARRSRLRPLS